MNKVKWIAYDDLAWAELILCSTEDYIEETELYCKATIDHSKNEVKTLLHLGCGAGINDYTFKNHFKVTGVDISKSMLKVARNLNPDITYIQGDMLTIRIPELYDAVAIPDSIGYKDDINITLFENNHILDSTKEKYEAVFTYWGYLLQWTDHNMLWPSFFGPLTPLIS